MSKLKDQNIVYVDSIRYSLDPTNGDVSNIINCPTTNMKNQIENDGRTFDYNKINHLISNPSYFNTSGNNVAMPFSEVQKQICGNGDFSGCCVIPTEISNNDYFDKCDANGPQGSSTGFVYKYEDNYYNVCHAQPIQDKVNMFSNYQNKKAGLDKFFMVLLVTIVMILFYTLFSLPYEFWLRYGNSIQCIYYKVKQTCVNMGSKKSDNNGKLTIIEYKFPDNLHSYPYEACKPPTSGDMKGGMKGGREKEDAINSNYIEYHENGSKCINLDFGSDPDDISKRPFPYNLGEYANTKVKNRYLAMILKGFSFYFLFTILLLRTIFNKVLSYFSKQYQKIYEQSSIISSLLLLLNFIITPFLIISSLVSLIFGVMSVFPMLITISDFFKSLNFFKDDIETTPSNKLVNDYYKIYNFSDMLYPWSSSEIDYNDDYFHKNNKFYAIILGIIVAFIIGLIVALKERPEEADYSGSDTQIITIIALFVCPPAFYIASKYVSMPQSSAKILDLVKRMILNFLIISIPCLFTAITTFAAGMTGSILAGLYMVLKLLFDFYVTAYSNSMEFLDLLKNHSKLLTILLLISVISSAAISGLGSHVSGTLGGLLALYLIYELYKISQ